jgi:hypothetical protein
MSALRHLSKKFGKYFDRRILASIIILSSSVWVLTYAVSDEMIQTQIDYLIWVIDANVAVQNLDENWAKNVFIGLREVYRWVIDVLNERIWDGGGGGSSTDCSIYTDPVERAICETTHDNGGSWTWTTWGNNCNDITLDNNQIWKGCDILDQAYSTSLCPAWYNIPTAGQWSKLIDSFPGQYVNKLSLTKRYYWTSSNSNNTQEKLLLYIKNDAGTDQLINPGLMTNKLTVRCIKDGSATTANGQPNPAYTEIPPAPIPYQKNYRKTCEWVQFEGANRIQNYRWYDTEWKPQDLITKCSQPNRVNGGLICSESANGCCPNGQIAMNGTCITPVDAGGSCYATSGCKDGLTCNSNKVCVGTATGGGTGGTSGAPTVWASVTGIASTTNPGTFTNKAPQGTNIQLQYSSSNVGNMISFQIFRGTGPLDNSNLASGTSYIQYANLPGNTAGTFNIPLQNLAIGMYRVVVTGCNSSNQCSSTPAATFEVIAAGGTGGGTGGWTWTVACTAGNQFNFSSNGKNCIGTMPVGPTVNFQTTVNATQWQGTAVVKCTPTGWTVITPNCTVDKDAGGDTGGGTGGGTGGNPNSDETPNDYQPGTVTPPAGYTDTSCQSSQTWSCPGSTSRSNPPTCYVPTINSEVRESDLTNANALCYPGYGGPRQVLGLSINQNNSTVTWFCGETKSDGSKKSEACAAKLKVNATCGSQAGTPIRREEFSLKNTPNLCSKWVPVKTYKYNGGTQFEPYYDYLIDDKSSWSTLDYNTAYLTYTCGGINGWQDAICETGKVIVDGECGAWVDTLYPTGLDGDINNPNNNKWICKAGKFSWTDQPSPVDGKNYAFKCDGYNGGRTVQCSVGSAPTNLAWACGDINGKGLGIGNLWGRDTLWLTFVHQYVGSNPPSTTGDAMLCNVATFGANITWVLNILDGNGNDGTYNWECNGKNTSGVIDTSTKATCSATKLKLWVCGTLNSGKISGKQVTWTIAWVYTGPGTGDANGNMKLSNYFLLPGTIMQYPSLCANGSPHTIVDDVGTDGTFNWKCAGDSTSSGQKYLFNDYANYNFANCSAEKINPADYTVVAPPPVISQFNSSKNSADSGEQVQLGWVTSNVKMNGCELRGITSKNDITISLTGRPWNSTQTVSLPNDGSTSVLYTLKCYNESLATVERSTVVTINVVWAAPENGECSSPLVKNTCKKGTFVLVNSCTSDEKNYMEV